MRVVLQRVKYAQVKVNDACIGKIEKGFMLLVGITQDDTLETIQKVAKKCAGLRIFEDEEGKMNLSLEDVQGDILSISQITLYADCKKGRRPSLVKAAKGEQANALYEAFNEELRTYGIHVETGEFGADMKVELLNDGPVTILLDSDEL